MVDLAGSERLAKSLAGDDPKTLKETQSINQSLSVFGQVFSALLAKAAHVPFRNSKLTHLLQVRAAIVFMYIRALHYMFGDVRT